MRLLMNMLSRVTGMRMGVVSAITRPAFRATGLIVPARYKSTAEKNASSEQGPASKSQEYASPIIKDIDSLLNASVQSSRQDYGSADFKNTFSMSSPMANPRDVAKSISPVSPQSGRSVDVHFGNLNKAIKDVNNMVRTNRLPYFVKVQKRFIRPAKYAKQIKREWWRRKFSDGFKDLMGQVRDARRRGY